MSKVQYLKPYDNTALDIAALSQLGICLLWLMDAPAEELFDLPMSGSSVYLQLWGFQKAIEQKLAQLEQFQRQYSVNG